jgi:hypothetical protein
MDMLDIPSVYDNFSFKKQSRTIVDVVFEWLQVQMVAEIGLQCHIIE